MKLNKILFPALGAFAIVLTFFALRSFYEQKLRIYEVRIQAVVPRQDHTEPFFFEGFEPETISRMVEDLNVIYFHSRIRFVFDPKTDLETLTSPVLHADLPYAGLSVEDTTLLTHQAQRKYARQHPEKLVIFFRNCVTCTANYSGDIHPYIRMSRGYHPKELAHEIGHYFHLPHTFKAEPEDGREALEMIREALEQGISPKEVGKHLFDGDGFSDTPNDPGQKLMCASNNRGIACINKTDCGYCLSGGCFYCRKCNSGDVVKLKVDLKDEGASPPSITEMDFEFRPDRQNVMAYYAECNQVHTLHFSDQQIAKMRSTLRLGNRKRLLN